MDVLIVGSGEVKFGNLGHDVRLGGLAPGVGGFGHGFGGAFIACFGGSAPCLCKNSAFVGDVPICWESLASLLVKEDKITRKMVDSYDEEVLR